MIRGYGNKQGFGVSIGSLSSIGIQNRARTKTSGGAMEFFFVYEAVASKHGFVCIGAGKYRHVTPATLRNRRQWRLWQQACTVSWIE